MERVARALVSFSCLCGCVGPGGITEGDGSAGTSSESADGEDAMSATTISTLSTTAETDDESEDWGTDLDVDTGPPPPIEPVVDLLIVMDNSGTMGEEQVNLASFYPELITRLLAMETDEGEGIIADVNIMVTSTDMGHPSCTPFQADGYEPLAGQPQTLPCTDRLQDFTGLGNDPLLFEQACNDACPLAVSPSDPFIHFEADLAQSNVPGNMVAEALGCIAPQGINGCGYESPLEAMLQAINPGATWNQGSNPFMRDGGVLAVVLITDEADCSVRSPDGYAYFTDIDTFWEVNPDTGTKTQATSAVCWNAGVDCGMPDQNGIYADCSAIDTDVLLPVSRYLEYLRDGLMENQAKEVVMLSITGVPPVTGHDFESPYRPTMGGVEELVYRDWRDGQFPLGDILPGDVDAPHKQWQFGIGPGCLGLDAMGGFSGQAIPPVRIREVCQGLDDEDAGELRCCMESICDQDYAPTVNCLTGMIQDRLSNG